MQRIKNNEYGYLGNPNVKRDGVETSFTKEETDEARRVTNNNVFVGSTTDLQRMLLNKDNIIDAKNQEQ